DYIGFYLTDGQQYYYNLAEAIYYAQTYYINCFVGYFSDSFTEEESKVYIEASKYVLEIAKRKNKDRDYSEIESLLKGESL
ncbi:MAG: hypothetical protein J5684_03360, partial [Eubacterium sp.]|nr:hypothetical protein [Eubacterium sp.]